MMRVLAIASIVTSCSRHDGGDRPRVEPPAPQGSSTKQGPVAMTSTPCDAAKQQIERRHFIGWRGLPAACTSDALFGVAFDETWGAGKLGADFEPARQRVLELAGYYRPMAYVREGHVVAFDGMNPELDADWAALSKDLGEPDAKLDWVHGTTPMSAGERVYAQKGITVFLNPSNDFVVYVMVYVPTTVEQYTKLLRPSREKRIGR
jgi:hypothetical protein